MTEDKRIIDMTAREFADFLKETLRSAGVPVPTSEAPEDYTPASGKRYVYGISGIAQLFDCSASTAWRIHTSGVIDKAVARVGRKIIVDADLAVDLVRESQNATR